MHLPEAIADHVRKWYDERQDSQRSSSPTYRSGGWHRPDEVLQQLLLG
jgi:hypothetical protein